MINKIKTNTLSIVATWFGLVSIFLWDFSLIPILAIIFGIIAIFEIRREKTEGTPNAWTGIGLGVIFLIVRLFN